MAVSAKFDVRRMRAFIWSTVAGVAVFLIVYAIASGLLAVLIGSLAFLAAYGFFKGKLYLGPTSLVDVLAFIISIASLYIALASYQEAQKSGAEQQRSLEASRKALESVIETAQKQRTLLEENLKTASTHLALVQQQRKEEMRRLAKKPGVEIGLGSISSKQLKALKHINVAVDENNVATFNFLVTNIGDAPVIQPDVLIIAEPRNVLLDQRGNRVSKRDNHNVVQFSGPTSLDLLPFEISKTPYAYTIDAVVPPTVKEFSLDFSIYGLNQALTTAKAHIVVIRSANKPQ